MMPIDAVANTSASPMISSVTKVVQPTATVSSVPVSGPSMYILLVNYICCSHFVL